MEIEKVWGEYQVALKSFLHTKVSNEADVDDLLQEVLIKTYHSFHTIKESTSVRSWLFQVANNTVIDFYRKNKRTKALDEQADWHLEDENHARSQLSNCILPFINELPEEQANLLKAIDIDNMSQKEHAEQLGISYSTLKSRVQKSRHSLKAVFDQCCHFSIDKRGNLFDYEEKPFGCNPCK